MFYSQYILTKRGPLARIWLAAHMQNKLTKTMVFSIDIVKACEKIVSPDAPMALRLTSNLLLGVVRVYARKAKYLLSDCSDAVSKIKFAFQITKAPVDLPEESARAQYAQVTIEETAPDELLESAAPVDLAIESMPELHLEPMLPIEVSGDFQAAEEDITLSPRRLDVGSPGLLDPMAEAEAERMVIAGQDDEGDQMPLAFEPLGAASPMEVEFIAEGPEGPASPTAGRGAAESPEVARRVSEPFNAVAEDITLGSKAGLVAQDDDLVIEEDAAEALLQREALDLSAPGPTEVTFEEREDGEAEEAADLELEIPGDEDSAFVPPDSRPSEMDIEEGLDESMLRPRRVRRLASTRFDRQTEIPMSRIRNAVRNTEDTIRVPKRRRVQASLESLPSEESLLRSSLLQPEERLGKFYTRCIEAALKSKEKKQAEAREVDAAAQAEAEGPAPAAPGTPAAGAPEAPETEPVELARMDTPAGDLSVELARERPASTAGDQAPELALSPPEAGTEVPEKTREDLPEATEDIAMPTPEMPALEVPQTPPSMPPFSPIQTELPSLPEELPSEIPTLTEVAETSIETQIESGRNARQEKLAVILADRLRSSSSVNFTDMIREEKNRGARNVRRTAARAFLELINLSSSGEIAIQQTKPYADLTVSKSAA